MRYEWTDRNPIKLVRQSAKRGRIPDVLELSEIQLLLSKLDVRERTLALLDAGTPRAQPITAKCRLCAEQSHTREGEERPCRNVRTQRTMRTKSPPALIPHCEYVPERKEARCIDKTGNGGHPKQRIWED